MIPGLGFVVGISRRTDVGGSQDGPEDQYEPRSALEKE